MILCTDLEDPANGKVTFTKGLAPKSKAKFSCDKGYGLKGDTQLTCALDSKGKKAKWSGKPPKCIRNNLHLHCLLNYYIYLTHLKENVSFENSPSISWHAIPLLQQQN